MKYTVTTNDDIWHRYTYNGAIGLANNLALRGCVAVVVETETNKEIYRAEPEIGATA